MNEPTMTASEAKLEMKRIADAENVKPQHVIIPHRVDKVTYNPEWNPFGGESQPVTCYVVRKSDDPETGYLSGMSYKKKADADEMATRCSFASNPDRWSEAAYARLLELSDIANNVHA